MRRTSRETDAVAAGMQLVQRRLGLDLEFLCHPDEEPVPGPRRAKAPDYLFVGDNGEGLMVEHSALATEVPMELSRARTSRMYEALRTISWPQGSYCVTFLTSDDRRVETLVGSGDFSTLIASASLLQPTTELDDASRFFAFHSRDPRYYLVDDGCVLLLSKDSADGRGCRIVGPQQTAPLDSELVITNQEGRTVRVPTTSRSLFDPVQLDRSLTNLFNETNEKFYYREHTRGLLLVDIGSYVAGPELILHAIRTMPVGHWPRITTVAIYADEPYSNPPPPSGETAGAYRFWLIERNSESWSPTEGP